jgi:hypothetical protein
MSWKAVGNTMVANLDAQYQRNSAKGRRISDREAYRRFVRAIADTQLSRFIKADLTADQQTSPWHITMPSGEGILASNKAFIHEN